MSRKIKKNTMAKVKVKVTNSSSKRTQYHYKSTVGSLSPGDTKEISIDIEDTLYFENDNSVKYKISANDNGRTFIYNK